MSPPTPCTHHLLAEGQGATSLVCGLPWCQEREICLCQLLCRQEAWALQSLTLAPQGLGCQSTTPRQVLASPHPAYLPLLSLCHLPSPSFWASVCPWALPTPCSHPIHPSAPGLSGPDVTHPSRHSFPTAAWSPTPAAQVGDPRLRCRLLRLAFQRSQKLQPQESYPAHTRPAGTRRLIHPHPHAPAPGGPAPCTCLSASNRCPSVGGTAGASWAVAASDSQGGQREERGVRLCARRRRESRRKCGRRG